MTLRSVLLAALVMVGALVAPGTAPASEPPPEARAILTNLAQRITHGWRDDGLPLAVLQRRLRDGERVVITCGRTSTLARRELHEAGFAARIVTTMTREPYNDIDNGHTMLEVRTPDGWEVWDLDNNRRPVRPDGTGMSVIELSETPRAERGWEIVADDEAYDLTGASPEVAAYAKAVYADIETWYDRVLGVPLIELDDGRFGFGDTAERARLESYAPGYYVWLPLEAWNGVVHADAAPRAWWVVPPSAPMPPALTVPSGALLAVDAVPPQILDMRLTRSRGSAISVIFTLSRASAARVFLNRRRCVNRHCAWRRKAARSLTADAGANKLRFTVGRHAWRSATYRVDIRLPGAVARFAVSRR